MNKILKLRVFKFKIFLLFILIITSSFSLHKYYVSLTTIEHNVKNNSIEITIQIFTDDLELTLHNFYKKSFDIGTPKEHSSTNDAINKYVNQKMNLKINNKSSSFNMIGKEIEDDMTIIYFEVTRVKNIKSIEITNKLLFETFDDQQHIIKVKSTSLHKNILFNKNNYQELIKF